MAFPKPFSLFGGKEEKRGGFSDYLGSHGSVDEARAQIDRDKPEWWQIVVAQEEELKLVDSSETRTAVKPRVAKTEEKDQSG
jgi:hypothetical protein